MQEQELYGLIKDMSNDDYHRGPGISKSHLDKIAKSPAHYWAAYIDPNREPSEPTAAMRMGTLIHTAVLEPDTLSARTIIAPEGIDRRTKDGKAAWAAFQIEAAGREIITADENTLLTRIQDRVLNHPIAGKLLSDGVAEQSFFSKRVIQTMNYDTGQIIEREEILKCRPDWMTNNGVMVDLKSTDDASPDGFGRSVVNYRYYIQAPWYCDILEEIYGEPPSAFVFIAVEKTWPHAVGVYFATQDQIEIGRDHYQKDLRQIVTSKATNWWPDFSSTEAQPIKLPGWFRPAV